MKRGKKILPRKTVIISAIIALCIVSAVFTCVFFKEDNEKENSQLEGSLERVSKVFINEVCLSNKNGIKDSFGECSDWIELYNGEETSVDIGGYRLSDSVPTGKEWSFPEGTIIESFEYLLIFCSGQSGENAELHTDFALNKGGEVLTLSTEKGTIVDTLNVPPLVDDTTYGRTPDGSAVLEIMSPTPERKNDFVLSQPVFSAISGFYEKGFELVLSSVNGAEIYYTTDGSDPTVSKTAVLYESPIILRDCSNDPDVYSAYTTGENATSIGRDSSYKAPASPVDKGMVIRAAAKSKDGKYSQISTHTYFVTDGELSKYKNMTVVSLVTDSKNFFDPDIGIYVNGTRYVEWKNSDSYNPDKSPWDTDNVTNYFARGKEWERETNVTIFENGNAVVNQNMGIRIKGASTRNHAQKSFNLNAKKEYGTSKIYYPLLPENYSTEGQLIKQYDSISLRAINFDYRLNDGIAISLLQKRDCLTVQNYKPCVVFFNGEFWGAYQMIEKLTEDFFEDNYGVPKEKVSFIKSGVLEEGDKKYSDELYDFVNTYSERDLTLSENYMAVCDFIDVDSMIEHYVAGIYIGTYDWPDYNYGMWRYTGTPIEGNKFSDGKWRFVTFDCDFTMGSTYESFGGAKKGYAYDNFAHMSKKNGMPTKLFVGLLKNEVFRNKFINVFCDYANEVTSSETANAIIEYYGREYTNYFALSASRWHRGEGEASFKKYSLNFKNIYLESVKEFFEKRESYALKDMIDYLSIKGTLKKLTLETEGNGQIKINTIIPDTTSDSWTGRYFSTIPITLVAVADENSTFKGWSGSVTGTDETITVTLGQEMTIKAIFE